MQGKFWLRFSQPPNLPCRTNYSNRSTFNKPNPKASNKKWWKICSRPTVNWLVCRQPSSLTFIWFKLETINFFNWSIFFVLWTLCRINKWSQPSLIDKECWLFLLFCSVLFCFVCVSILIENCKCDTSECSINYKFYLSVWSAG